jgi:DNA polymerase III epsilon subunit-like protein
LDSLRYVVLDTELTSLDPRSRRLLSIGAIAMEGAKIRLGEHLYRVVNPGEEIPVATIVVHGLRPVDVEHGCDPGEAARELFDFVGDSILVGHFVHIDLQVLRKELQQRSRQLLNPAIDTARVHYWLAATEARKRGVEDVNEPLDLATLAIRYSLQVEEIHHALHDAFLTAQLWQRLLPRLAERGVTTLKDVLRFARG